MGDGRPGATERHGRFRPGVMAAGVLSLRNGPVVSRVLVGLLKQLLSALLFCSPFVLYSSFLLRYLVHSCSLFSLTHPDKVPRGIAPSNLIRSPVFLLFSPLPVPD